MSSKHSPRRERGFRLVDVDGSNFDTLPCCGISNPLHPGRMEKRCWLAANARYGVKSKTLVTADGKPAGFIEYVPGEFAWRGIRAPGYLVIHCIWTYPGHRRQDCGRRMLTACLADAKATGKHGVAVVVRAGPWMADRRFFLSHGFEPVDQAPPDFELLVRTVGRLDRNAPNPSFLDGWQQRARRYGSGLTILRSSQCPHSAKFVDDIAESAREDYRLEPRIVSLESAADAQHAPTPYGTFALLLDGRLLADHPISRTRFRNIMNKLRV